jgi:hypothetical protein
MNEIVARPYSFMLDGGRQSAVNRCDEKRRTGMAKKKAATTKSSGKKKASASSKKATNKKKVTKKPVKKGSVAKKKPAKPAKKVAKKVARKAVKKSAKKAAPALGRSGASVPKAGVQEGPILRKAVAAAPVEPRETDLDEEIVGDELEIEEDLEEDVQEELDLEEDDSGDGIIEKSEDLLDDQDDYRNN